MIISPSASSQTAVPQRQDGKVNSESADFARVMECSQDSAAGTKSMGVEQPSSQHEGQLPLEAFALPQWLDTYIPDASNLTGEINHEYLAFAENLRSDGNVSDADRAMMRNYLNNDPQHQAMLKKHRFRQEFSQELREYHDILSSSFQAALKENGINSSTEYYEKVILDKGESQKIQQDTVSRLESSPRFSELMNILGVTA